MVSWTKSDCSFGSLPLKKLESRTYCQLFAVAFAKLLVFADSYLHISSVTPGPVSFCVVFNYFPWYCYSETVKFGHVTFFWNGNRSGYFNSEMEEYVEIPSDSGITFNVQPKMKALEIAEKTRDAILSRKFDQVIHHRLFLCGYKKKKIIF